MFHETREVVPTIEAAIRLAATLTDATRNTIALMAACPEHEPELRAAGRALAHAARRLANVVEALGDRPAGKVH